MWPSRGHTLHSILQERSINTEFPSRGPNSLLGAVPPLVCAAAVLLVFDHAAADLLESKVTQSLDAVRAAKSYNAFVSVDADAAIAAARELDRQGGGAVHGMTVAVKDNIHVAGLPNTAGTPALADFEPKVDATAVARLRAAGAIIVGKSNMHELAYGITSNNYAYGAVHNAIDAERFAGGSSGGTAVAVALGLVDAGLGTDTGGSVRIPAALNGVVGFRPTVGRYPNDAVTPISSTRDTIGPIARTVADVVDLDAVLSGDIGVLPDADLEELRIGVPRSYFYDDLEPEIAAAMETTLRLLSRNGVRLVYADLHDIAAVNGRVGMPIVIYETRRDLGRYLATYVPGVTVDDVYAQISSPDVRGLMSLVVQGEFSEDQYLEAINVHRPALQRVYETYFDEHSVDAILFPTTRLLARPIAGSVEAIDFAGEELPTFPTYIRNTDPGSNAGLPGLSIPVRADGTNLPVGVEIDGPAGSDRRLLSIGRAIEELLTRHGVSYPIKSNHGGIDEDSEK